MEPLVYGGYKSLNFHFLSSLNNLYSMMTPLSVITTGQTTEKTQFAG